MSSGGLIDIFTSGVGYKYFRIPSALRLPDGRITVYCEGRNIPRDQGGWIDVVYRTSLDTSGSVWGPLRVLHSETTNTSAVTIGNPSPVLDVSSPLSKSNGGSAVVILFARNAKQILSWRSLDPYGEQWPSSAPVDITPSLHLPGSPALLLTGPPGGIQLASSSGRLVQTAYYKLRGAASASSTALLSDDGGATWALSDNAISPGGESTVALAPNGSLVINVRAGGGTPAPRKIAWSDDGGASWSAPAQTYTDFAGSVEGSMIRLPGTDWLIFAHPYDAWAENRSAHPSGSACRVPSYHAGRCNMTLWGSRDSARTWSIVARVEPDPAEDAAYSSLVPINQTHVFVVYERAGYATITGRIVELRL